MTGKERILHIETSTEICSVCISEGERCIGSKLSDEPFVHTRQATLMIEAIFSEHGLKASDLDAISVSQGPGSYTGLRVGASIAKGMCFGLNIPLIAIKTLKSIAHAASDATSDHLYIPMIDARRMEVYLSQYDSELKPLVEDEPVILEEHDFTGLLSHYSKLVFCGNGSFKFEAAYSHPNYIFKRVVCDAKHLIPLAISKFRSKDFVNIGSFTPNYIKPAKVTKSKKSLF